MILHIVLYCFRKDVPEEQIQQCIRGLRATTKSIDLVSWHLSGYHVALPADKPVHDKVYEFAALWGFVDQKALDEFSKLPAVIEFEAKYVRPIVERLAMINVDETTDTSWGMLGIEEKKPVP